MSHLLSRILALAGFGIAVAGGSALADDQKRPAGLSTQVVQFAQGKTAEVVFWESVKDSKNPEELSAYLKSFPNGVFSELAKIRLKKLTADRKPVSSGSSPDTAITTAPEQSQNSESKKGETPNPTPIASPAGDIPPVPTGHESIGYIGTNIASAYDKGDFVGVRIVRFSPFGAAKNSSLRVGDILTKIDGETFASIGEFVSIISMKSPGTRIKLSGKRNGSVVRSDVEIRDWLKTFWHQAHAGDMEAMNLLGQAYLYGRSIGRDYGQSRMWFERAAKAGNADAHRHLGQIYANGWGVKIDHAKSFSSFMKSAELGNREGQFEVGVSYATSRGVPRSDEKSFNWYRKAAENGHALAMLNAGIRYQSGRGVRKSMKEAADWYEKAINAGNTKALAGLGYMYLYGEGGRKKDMAEAIHLFRKGADRGDVNGYHNLAILYEEGRGFAKDRKEAIRLYRKAIAADPDDSRPRKRLEGMKVPVYDLAEIQNLLSNLGYDPGAADGKMGRKTRQAIKQYQRSVSLKQTGKPSFELEQKLRSEKPGRSGNSVARQTQGAPAAQSKSQEDLSDLDAF